MESIEIKLPVYGIRVVLTKDRIADTNGNYYKSGKIDSLLIASDDKEFWRLRGGWHTPTFYDQDSPYRPRLVDFLCLKAASPAACKARKSSPNLAH